MAENSTDKLKIKQAIGNLDGLPTLPSMLVEVMNRVLDENSSVQDVSELVETDQSLTTKVLRVANSSFYGRPQAVSTVKNAIVILGFNKLKNIVLSISLMDNLESLENSNLDMKEFWRHSFSCAVLSQDISQRLSFSFSDQVFVAGLLHDIGKLILDLHVPDKFGSALELSMKDRIDLHEAERRIIGVDHGLVGKWIMEKWKFPDHLIEAAWMHHNPPGIDAQGNRREQLMTSLVSLANNVSNVCSGKMIGLNGTFDQIEKLRDRFKIPEDDLREIASRAEEKVQEIAQTLDRDIGSGKDHLTLMQRANQELSQINLDLDHTNRKLQIRLAERTALHKLGLNLQTCVEIDEVVKAAIRCATSGIGFYKAECVIDMGNGETYRAAKSVSELGQVAASRTNGGSSESSIVEGLELHIEGVRIDIYVENRTAGYLRAWRRDNVEFREREAVVSLSAISDLVSLTVHRCLEHRRSEEHIEKLALAQADLESSYRKLPGAQKQIIQMERLNALGEVAAGMAHEFNNILGIILGQSQILHRSLEQPESKMRLKAIEKATMDGAEIIAKIQDSTRPRQEVNFVKVDINEIIEEVIDITRPNWEREAQIRGIQIQLHRGLAGVPPIFGNPVEIREIFTNLIFNSIDAMPDGGDIYIKTESSGDSILITASDTGVGIPNEIQNKVFDPFFTTKGANGSDLGLSLVYGIVERHKGEIKVHSIPNKGATFIIRLPVYGDRITSFPESSSPTSRLAATSAERARNIFGSSERIASMEHPVQQKSLCRTGGNSYRYFFWPGSRNDEAFPAAEKMRNTMPVSS